MEKVQLTANDWLRKITYYPFIITTIGVYLFSIYFGGIFLRGSSEFVLNSYSREINVTSLFQIIGLGFAFIGSIVLTFSFIVSETIGTHPDSQGKIASFVVSNFKKRRFYFSLILLSVGFLTQIISYFF